MLLMEPGTLALPLFPKQRRNFSSFLVRAAFGFLAKIQTCSFRQQPHRYRVELSSSKLCLLCCRQATWLSCFWLLEEHSLVTLSWSGDLQRITRHKCCRKQSTEVGTLLFDAVTQEHGWVPVTPPDTVSCKSLVIILQIKTPVSISKIAKSECPKH